MKGKSTDFEEIGTQFEKVPMVGNSGGYRKPPSNNVQKAIAVLSMFAMAVLVVVLGLTSATEQNTQTLLGRTPPKTVTVAYQALGFPGFEQYSWSEVVSGAFGQTVHFWAYGDAPVYNDWIDNFLTPNVAQLYGVKLVRVPINATAWAATQLLAEKAAGNNNKGMVDLVWINGNTFSQCRDAGLLYGPWAEKVPNAVNFDFNSAALSLDFGEPTQGFEMPYNSAQIVFAFNPDSTLCPGLATVASSGASLNDLVNWIKSHPGKFTYANPYLDYTGSAFIRHVFYYYVNGGYSQFLTGFNRPLYAEKVGAAFQVLRALNASVYVRGGQPYYPDENEEVDALFGSGDICLTLAYDPNHPGEMVAASSWPAQTGVLLPSSGTIGNVNFVAIGYNAKATLGAMVVGDYIASMSAQYKRLELSAMGGIGAMQAYSPTAAAVVEGGWSVPFADAPSYPQTPSRAALAAAFLPEINSDYDTVMQADWVPCVLYSLPFAVNVGNVTGTSGAPCS